MPPLTHLCQLGEVHLLRSRVEKHIQQRNIKGSGAATHVLVQATQPRGLKVEND